jgi:hypothetical protein
MLPKRFFEAVHSTLKKNAEFNHFPMDRLQDNAIGPRYWSSQYDHAAACRCPCQKHFLELY